MCKASVWCGPSLSRVSGESGQVLAETQLPGCRCELKPSPPWTQRASGAPVDKGAMTINMGSFFNIIFYTVCFCYVINNYLHNVGYNYTKKGILECIIHRQMYSIFHRYKSSCNSLFCYLEFDPY